MGTSYGSIYERFLSSISDYSFSVLTQQESEDIFLTYLKKAVPKFTQCKTDLIRDDNVGEFQEDLTELEQEILAAFMVVEWINPKVKNADLLEMYLGSKDFRIYSPANMLKELREAKNDVELEKDRLLVMYTYNNEIEELS